MERVEITAAGGGAPLRRPVPEQEHAYPQVTMFGDLPASVLYVRHARRVTLRAVKLATERPDGRGALVTDDAAVVETPQ